MYSLLPQSEAPKATVVEWINDDLPEVDFANPLADGTDITLSDTTNELANRVRVGNRIQQFQLAELSFSYRRNVGCSRRT